MSESPEELAKRALALALLDLKAFDEVAKLLGRVEFSGFYRNVWNAIRQFRANRWFVAEETIRPYIPGVDTDISVEAQWLDLVSTLTTTNLALDAAKRLRANADREHAKRTLQQIAADIESGELEPSMAAARASERLATFAEDEALPGIGELLDDALDRADRLAAGEEAPVPVPFSQWSEALAGGFHPGVHFLVGGTKVGKSTLLSQVILHAARKGHPVALAPLEIGRWQATIRLASEAAGVPWRDMCNGKASDNQRATVRDAAARLGTLPIFIDGASPNGWPASRIERLAAQCAKRGGNGRTPLVVVDFLQILGQEPNNPRADLRERIGKASYEAQRVAEAYSAAVVLVSSVARQHYPLVGGLPKAWKDAFTSLIVDEAEGEVVGHHIGGADHLKTLGKEAGEIEYAATSINVMVRTRDEDGRSAPRTALVIPAQRMGELSETWIPLRFERGRFIQGDDGDARAIAEALREKPKSKPPKNEGGAKSGYNANLPKADPDDV